MADGKQEELAKERQFLRFKRTDPEAFPNLPHGDRAMTKALVTGATRAPGRAIATTLAKEGWEVHALGRMALLARHLHVLIKPMIDG